jgi:hypothetical protein
LLDNEQLLQSDAVYREAKTTTLRNALKPSSRSSSGDHCLRFTVIATTV